MLAIFFNAILITLFFTPYGFFLSNENKKNLEYFSKQLIYGLIIICFIALTLNFFFPLYQKLNTLILIIPILILINQRKIYLTRDFLQFLLFSTFLILLLIVKSNIYRPDAGLYHLPYIKILNDEKIIFGLSNLHFRYAHISIIQYLSAISNNLIFQSNGIVFAQALIAVAVIINFLSKVYTLNKVRQYNFHFYYLIGILIFIIYKMNRYSEYGNDAPAHFLLFFLISELISQKKNHRNICNASILTIFIILNKITLLMCLFLNIFSLKDIQIKKILSLKRFYFLLIFTSFWIVKNIVVSGCILYPVESLCSEKFIWTNIKTVKSVSAENEAWAKGWPDYVKIKRNNGENIISNEKYSKNFFWLNYWSKVNLKKILKILIPYILVLTIIIFYIGINQKKKFIKKNEYLFFIFVMLLASIFWFLKVPTFRYGYSYLISIISLIFAYCCIHIHTNKKINKKIINSFIILCIIVISLKNIIRIVTTDNNYNNYPWPKYYSMDKNNIRENNQKVILNGKNFYTPPKNNYCMFSESPCANYGINNINLKKIKNDYIILFK